MAEPQAVDILRVLSRGTTKPKRVGGKAVSGPVVTLLPSAGVKTNPQLFHDDVGPPAKGTKRKRPAETTAQSDNTSDDDLSDADFFAPKAQQSQKSHDVDDGKISKSKSKKPGKGPGPDAAVEALELDQCKRILRSHRLKFTLMPVKVAAETKQPAKVEKSSKKKKKKAAKLEEEQEEAKAKDHKKKQIFPQPLTSFAELRSKYRISTRLAENLVRDGYKIPTEVQLGSLPLLLDSQFAFREHDGEEDEEDKQEADVAQLRHGADFLAVAPTGSGKTLSFLIPALNSILKRRAAAAKEEGAHRAGHGLEAVVVAPTRELASQIANEARKLAVGTGVRVVLMRKGMRVASAVGGDDAGEQEEEDVFESDEEEEEDASADEGEGEDGKKSSGGDSVVAATKNATKADILITTPMLLLNFLTDGKGADASAKPQPKRTLPDVRSLILDEADVLLDPLFRDQTLGIWAACTSPELRATFWSATMGSNIETLILDQLRSHHRRTAAAERRHSSPPPPLVRLVVGLKDAAVPNIAHRLIYTATEAGKLLALRQLLHPSSSGAATAGAAARDTAGAVEDETPLRPPFLVFTQTIERAAALHDELKYDIPAAAGGSARLAVLHSSLPDSQRAAVVRRFRAGEVWVLITTDVLARGVDFAGVNGVVNYDVPGSAAAYVHRAGRTGRAGRGGGLAVTLYTKEDIPFVKSVANVIAVSERQAAEGNNKNGSGVASGGGTGGVQKWLLDALPDVSKKDRKTLREKGVESRRSGAGVKSKITSRSGWERRRENNRRGAIEASKRRKTQQQSSAAAGGGDDDGDEWGGIAD